MSCTGKSCIPLKFVLEIRLATKLKTNVFSENGTSTPACVFFISLSSAITSLLP